MRGVSVLQMKTLKGYSLQNSLNPDLKWLRYKERLV